MIRATSHTAPIALALALAFAPAQSGCDCNKKPAPKLSPKPKPKRRKPRVKVGVRLRPQMKRVQQLMGEMKRRIGHADASRIVGAIKAIGDIMLTSQRGAAPYQALAAAFDLLQRRETAVGRFIALDIKRASYSEAHPNERPTKSSDKERKERQEAVAALQGAYRQVVDLCIKCHEHKDRRSLPFVKRLRL